MTNEMKLRRMPEWTSPGTHGAMDDRDYRRRPVCPGQWSVQKSAVTTHNGQIFPDWIAELMCYFIADLLQTLLITEMDMVPELTSQISDR